MEVLDENFAVYQNTTGEKLTVDIIYRKNKPATNDELFSLHCNMLGITYSNANNDNLISLERLQRMENYQKELKNKLATI